MPMRRRAHKRKPARRVRRVRRRVKTNSINKSYNTVFKPEPQWLASSSVGGTLLVTGRPGIISPGATSPSSATSSTLSLTIPSVTGFANYFDFGAGIYFKLADCRDSGRLIGVFDQYKINWVDVTITYLCNNTPVQGAGVLPTMYYVKDNDNADLPTNINDVNGKQGSKKFLIGNRDRTSVTIRVKASPCCFGL